MRIPPAACISSAIATICSGTAHAQSASDPSSEIPEVVVTARKREETLINAPLSVQALSTFLVDEPIDRAGEPQRFTGSQDARAKGREPPAAADATIVPLTGAPNVSDPPV